MNIADIRRDYARTGLLEADSNPDPIEQFRVWFQQAVESQLPDANAMTLATANAQGHPSARIVLLKEFDHRGFVFFTNYESRKGQELAANPHAALVFFWPELERQVRIRGTVARVTREESAEYFRSRPEASRLGAWASHQSTEIASRETLEGRFTELSAQYEGEEIPIPPYWGGYRLQPTEIEFWQGRPSRLHDRLDYVKEESGEWAMRRLAP